MQDWTKQDREHRERLEKMSAGGQRVDVCGVLNGLAKVHAAKEMPGLTALDVVRKVQEINRRSPAAHNRAHDRFEKAGGLLEGFNRLHPDSLGKATRVRDAAGSLDGGARDLRPSGEVEAIDAEWLLAAARALIEAVRARSRFPADRRD
jgi:hypothetical protein